MRKPEQPVPVRATVNLTMVDRDGMAAERVLALSDALERFGMILESAGIEVMAAHEVIPGSPLAHMLAS